MKKGKKVQKIQKKKRRNALWIPIVIHSDFGIGE
jgi:hypothetical protein